VKNKSYYTSAAVLLSLTILFVSGCQPQEPVIEYKKYENAAAVPRMSVEQAKKEFDAGTAVFVDSRAESVYKLEHIKGALIMPSNVNDADRFASLPKGKKIIVYCS